MRLWDKTKQHETSLSDSEDEGTGGRKHRQSHREANGSKRKQRRSGSPTVSTPGQGTNGTINSGLLDDPPTADPVRTGRAAEADVEMSDSAAPVNENGTTAQPSGPGAGDVVAGGA